jgi:hypothetical protein
MRSIKKIFHKFKGLCEWVRDVRYNTIASAKNYTENILRSLMNITFPAAAEDSIPAGQGQPSHERG